MATPACHCKVPCGTGAGSDGEVVRTGVGAAGEVAVDWGLGGAAWGVGAVGLAGAGVAVAEAAGLLAAGATALGWLAALANAGIRITLKCGNPPRSRAARWAECTNAGR